MISSSNDISCIFQQLWWFSIFRKYIYDALFKLAHRDTYIWSSKLAKKMPALKKAFPCHDDIWELPQWHCRHTRQDRVDSQNASDPYPRIPVNIVRLYIEGLRQTKRNCIANFSPKEICVLCTQFKQHLKPLFMSNALIKVLNDRTQSLKRCWWI